MLSRTVTSFALVAVFSASFVAAQDPVGYTIIQTDAMTGDYTLSAYSSGILFTGTLPAPTLNQKDASAQPVPASAIGFMNAESADAAPGANVGFHLGWSGTATLTGKIRDDLDPNTATSDPTVTNVYNIDVPLTMISGRDSSYRIDLFDDNSSAGGANDAVGGPRFAVYAGDDGSGHRQTGDTRTFNAGPDTTFTDSSFSLGGDADGDNLGFTSAIRNQNGLTGNVYADTAQFRGELDTSGAPTFVESIASPSAVDGVITGVSVSGSGLAPEGAAVQTGGFGEDALMFTDRTHEWNSDAGQPTIADLGLVGVDYIQFANDDKTVGDFQAQIDLAPGTKDLYLLIDERNSPENVFNTLNGNAFADTGVNIGADESGDGDIDNVSSLFVLPGYTGDSITLGANIDGGNMFGFLAAPSAVAAAVPEPASIAIWTLIGLGLAGFGYRRYRQGNR